MQRIYHQGLKDNFYGVVVTPTLLNGTDCWTVNYVQVQKMRVAVMRMLKWMWGHTRRNKIKTEVIQDKLGVA